MDQKQILTHIQDSQQYRLLLTALSSTKYPKVNISGYTGSWMHMVVVSIMSKLDKDILLVAPDREAAAYALGDMQYLLGEDNVLFYPSSYRRAYQVDQVDNANILLRAEALSKIKIANTRHLVITYPEALFEKVIGRGEIDKNTYKISVGDGLSMDFMYDVLEGYEFDKVDFVTQAGQYSIRGGIVDVFSYACDEPLRMEFFGDTIESIRAFDPQTQLSTVNKDSFVLMPNIEDKKSDTARQSVFDYMDANTLIVTHNISSAASQIAKSYEKAEQTFCGLKDSLIGRQSPGELFITEREYCDALERKSLVELSQGPFFKSDLSIESTIEPQPIFHKNFAHLGENLLENTAQGLFNLIFCTNQTQSQRLIDIFEDVNSKVRFQTIESPLHEGFIDRGSLLACYTDHQIFERYHRYTLPRGWEKSQVLSLSELNELESGDFVTHIDHGIGKFAGLQKIEVDGRSQEAIKLIYSGGDILYVSIHSLHKISKYSGREAAEPKINRLGSPAWKALKDKAKKRVKQIAFDLIKLYATRRQVRGFAFSKDNYLQNELEASFIYEDTPDQLKSTVAIKQDMESERPMDRLVCGDVGFGKTEVAIRAAFKAACDSKQVAVLVPTTILAFQHYRSFASRLKRMPVRVDYLNRFRTAKEKAQILQDLADGKIDILIGTHQLVSQNVKFKDLGLLVIDEEHKFGVGVKDKLKTIKENVDTLTLTATPIPRTLQFSLLSARDLSVIATPPPNRHPIQTQVVTFDQELIRDAVQYELARGGQVFFINNRIENLKEIAGMIQRLVPDARIGVGHGQLKGTELEKLMLGFMEGEFDVLVSTTIVESGLDVPNANTIFINNAHQFGLSDLHQMRGRVGRSNKNAFCYYIAPPYSSITDDARHRLEALEKYSAIGQGINIAMKDLEIRGAGDLLGAEQSGFISDIGFDTYQKILSEAVDELKSDEFSELYKDSKNDSLKFILPQTQIDTDLETLIPDSYVSSSVERLKLYSALSNFNTKEELSIFATQLKDRFGTVPDQISNLMCSIEVKWAASALGVERLSIKKGVMRMYFIEDNSSPYYKSDIFARVLSFGQRNSSICRFEEKSQKNGSNVLVMKISSLGSVQKAKQILDQILYNT